MNDREIPGLKQDALIELGSCIVCNRKLLEPPSANQGLTFYRVRVERVLWDPNALRRAAGLEMQIGALARIMGADEDLAKIFAGPFEFPIHEECAMARSAIVPVMVEAAIERRDDTTTDAEHAAEEARRG